MSQQSQKPTRRAGTNSHDDYVEEHPAYALIGASRMTSTPGHALFGSDFLHQHFIRIAIRPAEVARGLSNDWVHGTRTPYIEVDLSEAQWATFVSSMNVGDGVPCTTTFLADSGFVPGIVPDTNRRDQFNSEVADTLRDAIAKLEEVRDAAPTKALRSKVDLAIQELRSNLPFVARQFDEHAEKTVERAKMEVNAYTTRMLMRAGLAALDGEEALLELPEPTKED